MAKASWCTVAPMSGSKNGSIAISASAHTGRAARTTNVIVTNANGTKPTATIAVSQAAAPVTSTIDATKPDIPKTGGTVVVNGTSNSQKLRIFVGFLFTTSQNTLGLTANGLTGTISINGGAAVPLVKDAGSATYSVFNVYAPSGDPGAVAKYTYTLNLTFGASLFPIDVTYKIRVVDSRHADYDVVDFSTISSTITETTPPTGAVDCTTKLLAGLSTVSAAPTTVALVTAGTAKNVAITSNDDWTVS